MNFQYKQLEWRSLKKIRASTGFFFRLLHSNCLYWKFTATITYHLHIHPQFLYESFHILYVISLLSRENKNSQLTSLPMCGFIAQLVEHRTGVAEVTGSNPVEALIFFFFRLLHSNCLYWKFTATITYHLEIFLWVMSVVPFVSWTGLWTLRLSQRYSATFGQLFFQFRTTFSFLR